MASVELIDVAKRYGKQTVLQPLDLTIPDGSFTVLVGPSGCGKSTLLRLLAGLETLSGGRSTIWIPPTAMWRWSFRAMRFTPT